MPTLGATLHKCNICLKFSVLGLLFFTQDVIYVLPSLQDIFFFFK